MFNLEVNSEKCTGCRACELACSYHHGKIFNPRLASLHVHRVEKEGKISIIFYKDLPGEEKRKRFPCDGCVDKPEPQCVKYCVPGALTVS